MKRDKLADALKGYACLLVVLGHVMIGIRTAGGSIPFFAETAETFIWSFHIDLFMFLSGYVYSVTGGFKSKGGKLKFLGNKLLNLGVPYFVFSSLYIAVNSLIPGVNTPYSLTDILFLWKTPVAQYWFLYALFWLFVFWTVLPDKIPNYIKTAGLYAVFVILKIFGVNMGFLDSSMNCVLAFGLGTCLKSLSVEKIPTFARVGIVILHLISAVVIIKTGIVNYLFVDDLLTVFGIFSSVCFIYTLSKISAVSRFLDFICTYSFQIYLLHTFFTAAVRILLIKFGISNYAVNIAAGLIFGIFLPVVIAKIAALTPYLDFFFAPARSIKKMRRKTV